LKFFIPHDEYLRIGLVNLAGRNSAVLVDENASDSSFSTVINTPRDLHNETYLLTIILGDHTTVKKIVVNM
jgi:hypothetical protein